jgi:cephalosporin hydroxylase
MNTKTIYLIAAYLLSTVNLATCSNHLITSESTIFVHGSHATYTEPVLQALDRFNIRHEESETCSDDNALYIIFDAHTLNKKELPKHYIVYQTLDLSGHLTTDYLEILRNAVAVWDYSTNNINNYRYLNNYYYFPPNYEYADPVILPCLLSLDKIDAYKKMLVYSNEKDTDISSHIPALFAYTVSANPKLIIEAGVRGGQSTKPFYQAMEFCSATMLGIDIEASYAAAYNSLKNTLFLHMDDLNFADYYQKSEFKNQPLDFVFIDTSHEYQQTLAEIKMFVPLLAPRGTLAFHDSNVTPLPNHSFMRINGTYDSAPGNTRGVTQGIKEYFSLEFDEYSYINTSFVHNGTKWHMIHYPFCNGLTIMQKLN